MNAVMKSARTACLVAISLAVVSTNALADWQTGGLKLRMLGKLEKGDLQTTTIKGAKGSYILHTPHTKELFGGYLSGAKLTNNGGYLQVDNSSEYNNYSYRGQCVSFVKAFSGKSGLHINKGSKDITPQTNIPMGTVIATFKSNGDYWGHIAIALKITSDGVYVIDQNWKDDKRVAMHIIKFGKTKKSNESVDVTNAYHYSTVR